jgi:formylglycine-generating enzyme required for sulfatase activity
VIIPEGDFLMGAADYDNQAESNEKPRRTVFLDSYWIYKFEVTNSQYRDCIDSGTCLGNVEDYTQDSYPVVSLTWHEATNYCEWAGGRLPTEAEWEKAARGEGMNIYPWGNTSPNCILANYSGCVGGPDQVGSYPNGASPYGVLDMAGNVWEWIADWYDPDYYNQSGNTNNPLTSSYTGQKVIRGGSWGLGGNQLRASFRGSFYPDDSYNNIGFRCVLDSPSE